MPNFYPDKVLNCLKPRIIVRKFIAIFALSAPNQKQTRILSNIVQISQLTLRK